MHRLGFFVLATVLLGICGISYSDDLRPPDPVDIPLSVEAVAKVVSEEYFDSEVGAKVADTLRQRLNEGEYNQQTSLEQLAASLTTDLQDLTKDKHLAVFVISPTMSDQMVSDNQASLREREGRRSNFGIQQVAVLPGNVGLLNLTAVYRPEEAASQIAAAFEFLRHTDALILDLRENTGGSPDTVALVMSYFFEEPELHLFEIIDRSKQGRRYTTLKSPSPIRDQKRPTYVLTSSQTFSAGEGLAFLLQEKERAEIIGEITAGAANPGRAYFATSRLEVIVPNGQLKSVTGKNWEQRGVTPDVFVSADEALNTAQLRALSNLQKQSKDLTWNEILSREIKKLGLLSRPDISR